MATITAAAGGGFWNVGSTWDGGVVPLTTDDVVLNATSGQVTISANAQCKDINFSGYTNTITFNANLTITGDLTRSTSVFSYLGTGGIIIAGTTAQIINSSAVAWNIPVTFGGVSPNININGAFNIDATLTLSSTTSPIIARANVFDPAENVNPSGNITISGNGTYTGSANIVVLGSNNQTLTASGSHQIRNNLTINKTGGVLTLSGTLNYNTGTLTYVASGGTVDTTGNTLIIGASTTLNTGGMSWNNVTIAGNQTLLSDLNVLGNLTTQTTAVAFSGAFNVNVKGNLAINIATSGASTPILLNGTGAQSWTHGSAVYLSNNLTINKASGTLTIGSLALPNVYYRTGTLTYNNIGGTVDTATNLSTLNIGGNTTLNTNGITWHNFAIQAASILTLSSDFTWSNNWIIPASYTTSFAVSVGNLTPTSTANINFTAAQVTLKNDITVNNVTRNGGRMDNNKVNIIGNLSIVTNSTTAGTTIFEINGTGNQSWTATAYLVNPMIINKPSGTLTMGNIVYHSSNFTYTQGNIDFTTNNNSFWVGAGTYITTGLIFNTFVFASFGSSSITLGSDLYANTFTAGGNGSIIGIFNIYSQTLNINNSVSLSSTVNITFNGIFYCSGDCTFSGAAGGVSTTNANVYVGGSCFLSNSLLQVGSSNLYMVGNGVLSLPTVNFSLISNIYFDTSGKIVITGNLSKGTSASPSALIMSLIRGNVDAKKATLTLGANLTHTLTNMHKIVWGVVSLRNTSSIFPTLIMNEFFCGDATTNTNISLSDTTATALNAVVTFTDNFEKIAKFVNINGITFTRPQQLLLLTNQPKKSRNKGIRYNNQSPNGIPKGDPSVQNTQTAGQTRNLLVGDPSFSKTI